MTILTYRSVTNYYLQLDVHELAGDLPRQVVEQRAPHHKLWLVTSNMKKLWQVCL